MINPATQAAPMQTTSTSTYKIHFSDPIAQTIESNGKKYYMQTVTNDGKDVFICSDWFRSEGIKPGFDKKPELLFKTVGKVRDVLNVIEHEAVRQLRMPPELVSNLSLTESQLDVKTIYKPVHSGDVMYAKLHRDCSFFNLKREVIKKTDLEYGEYRVVIHVKGLYIGNHPEKGVTASLHIRIFQIQYRELNVQCLFDLTSGIVSSPLSQSNAQNIPTDAPTPIFQSSYPPPPTEQPLTTNTKKTQQPSTTNKKNGRGKSKAGLMRQNGTATVEALQQVPMEALPNDFFADLNV